MNLINVLKTLANVEPPSRTEYLNEAIKIAKRWAAGPFCYGKGSASSNRKKMDKQCDRLYEIVKKLKLSLGPNKPFYRGVNLSRSKLLSLLNGATIQPIYAYESWSSNLEVPRLYGIFILKKIPPTNQRVCYLPELIQYGGPDSANELITKSKPFNINDVFMVYDPDTRKFTKDIKEGLRLNINI